MHELSLAMSLLEVCEEEATRIGVKKIKTLIVEVGELSGVSVPALDSAFGIASRGTVAEGAALSIRNMPGTGWGLSCERAVRIQDPFRSCPDCGGSRILPTGGMEFCLKEFVCD